MDDVCTQQKLLGPDVLNLVQQAHRDKKPILFKLVDGYALIVKVTDFYQLLSILKDAYMCIPTGSNQAPSAVAPNGAKISFYSIAIKGGEENQTKPLKFIFHNDPSEVNEVSCFSSADHCISQMAAIKPLDISPRVIMQVLLLLF